MAQTVAVPDRNRVGERHIPTGVAGQRVRKRIDEAFDWIKSVAGLRQTKLRGPAKIDWA